MERNGSWLRNNLLPGQLALALARANVQEKLGEEFAKDLPQDIACPVSSP